MKNDHIWELLARKMSGEASPEELRELDEILQKDPHLHFSIRAITELWRNYNTTSTLIESKKAYAKHLDRMRQEGMLNDIQNISNDNETVLLKGSRRTPFQSKLRWPLLAFFLIFAGGLTWYFLRLSNTEPVVNVSGKGSNSEVSTKYGSKTRIQLPDGSQVWLNAGSKLNYTNDFGEKNREVQLLGEGFFDVVKNPQKPFIIHTFSIDIKVTGTQFNVKSYPGDKTSETSLVRGSVEVIVRKRPDEKYILKPNEKLVVLNEGDTIRKNIVAAKVKTREVNDPIIAIKKLTYKIGDSISVETAWTYNKLSFEDEAFEEVAKKMERWYDVKFEFRNSKLEEIRMNGSFINETLPQAMEALKYTNRFRYEIEGKKIIVY